MQIEISTQTSTDLKTRLLVTIVRKIRGKEHANSLGWNVIYNLLEVNLVNIYQKFNEYSPLSSNTTSRSCPNYKRLTIRLVYICRI